MKVSITVDCDTPQEAEVILARLTKGTKGTWLDLLSAKEDKFADIICAKSEVPSASAAAPVEPVVKVARLNISPGEPSIGKIGTDTKTFLLGELKLGRISAKHAEHYKLLWKRGEIKFDGKDYYL